MPHLPYAALSLPLFLAACGGSGSGPQTVPLMAAGFATAQTDYSQAYEFTDNDVAVIKIDDTTAAADTVSLSFSGTPQSSPVEFVFEGETYTLAYDPNTDALSFNDADVDIRSYTVDGTENTRLNYFAVETDDLFTSGYYLFGYDTAPAAVANLTGQATYLGTSVITLRDTARFGFGSGDLSLDVDFTNDTVQGGLFVSYAGGRTTFPPFFVSFNETPIDENGFRGTTSVETLPVGAVFSNGVYYGRFYENQAAAVGGQFSGEVFFPTFDSTLQYEGAFVGAPE